LLEYQHFLKHCSLFLRFQQNYFDDPTKLFSDSDKILDPSAKLFSPCIHRFISPFIMILLDIKIKQY